jgi:hypothetical protein
MSCKHLSPGVAKSHSGPSMKKWLKIGHKKQKRRIVERIEELQ